MSYRSRLTDDYDYWRETQAWYDDLAAWDREDTEQDRKERERYTQQDTRLPLLPEKRR